MRWHLEGGRSLLAENGATTYAITLKNELTVVDNNKAQRLFSFYIPRYRLSVANNEDALVFLADLNGRIVALEPDRIQPRRRLAVTQPVLTASDRRPLEP